MFELKCIFEEILENKSGTTQKGKEWFSLKFRVSWQSGNYENYAVFSSSYKPLIERVEALGAKTSITVVFTPSANYWKEEDKWFASNVALKVMKDEDAPV
ncbi:MAG TPA: hypothetical protein VMV77_05665 [Bacteroidales bacterium]|nr:hypothetical protein [Bacteroidales bacterium]